MKFSVIMASYLGDYPTAAMDREKKIIRAVDSVLNQTFNDCEIIVVADGCEKTFEIISNNYSDNEKVSVIKIKKQAYWSGVPRNVGKHFAKGDYILYLDVDDYYGLNHFKIIEEQLNGYDWVYYQDYRYDVRQKKWRENIVNIYRIGFNGTSNVCYKRILDVSWDYVGYAHDFHFNQQLVKRYKNFTKIKTPEYFVCHLPKHGGNNGYDI
jgi:glycosyltransferase involved in cell wall biosynthesis